MKVFFLVMDQMSIPTVFSKKPSGVEITVDMTFDESNGSQVEKVDSSVVENEGPPCEAIKQLTIGDIRPQDVEVPQVAAAPISADVPDELQQQTPAATPVHGSAMPQSGSTTPTQSVAANFTLVHEQNLQPIFEQDEYEDPKD